MYYLLVECHGTNMNMYNVSIVLHLPNTLTGRHVYTNISNRQAFTQNNQITGCDMCPVPPQSFLRTGTPDMSRMSYRRPVREICF